MIASNAVKLSRILKPSTGRYYLWADDGSPWCMCSRCRELSASDQNLIAMNAILTGLQKEDKNAKLAYLAYLNTMDVPSRIKPLDGIFLEFAPIERNLGKPLGDAGVPENAAYVEKLDMLVEFFGPNNAQALEYWLDVSLLSHYTGSLPKELYWIMTY